MIGIAGLVILAVIGLRGFALRNKQAANER